MQEMTRICDNARNGSRKWQIDYEHDFATNEGLFECVFFTIYVWSVWHGFDCKTVERKEMIAPTKNECISKKKMFFINYAK